LNVVARGYHVVIVGAYPTVMGPSPCRRAHLPPHDGYDGQEQVAGSPVPTDGGAVELPSRPSPGRPE